MPKLSLKLKPSKCCIMRASFPFLGHVVIRERVKVDPAKTESYNSGLPLDLLRMLGHSLAGHPITGNTSLELLQWRSLD